MTKGVSTCGIVSGRNSKKESCVRSMPNHMGTKHYHLGIWEDYPCTTQSFKYQKWCNFKWKIESVAASVFGKSALWPVALSLCIHLAGSCNWRVLATYPFELDWIAHHSDQFWLVHSIKWSLVYLMLRPWENSNFIKWPFSVLPCVSGNCVKGADQERHLAVCLKILLNSILLCNSFRYL